MFLTIDTDDPRPIYSQIAGAIKEMIARGELKEGAALPSVRQLASDLGVNLNTIATAYRELQEEGLLEVRQGSGSVVTARTIHARSESDLVRPLRTALTDLLLSGFSPHRIQQLVLRELRMAGKASKS